MLRILILSTILASLAGCNLFSSKPSIASTHNTADASTVRHHANTGSGAAQYALAYRYYYGIGVQENTNLAVHWMRKSKQSGYPLARSALPIIEAEQRQDEQHSYQPAYHPRPAYIPEGPSNRDEYAHLLHGVDDDGSDKFTIAIVQSKSKADAQRFIAKNDLHDATIKAVQDGKKTRYQVVSGEFSSASAAREHVKSMPEDVKELRPSVLPITKGDASQ
jgi:septal ring-binding cell division protein DamX